MLIDDQPHCRIEYHPETQCVTQTWKGFAKSSEFRASIEKTIDVFRQYHPTFILSDTREADVVDQADAEWVVQHANPILISQGMTKIAFVLPKKFFARWSVDHFFRGAKNQPLKAAAFEEPDAAWAWLAEPSPRR